MKIRMFYPFLFLFAINSFAIKNIDLNKIENIKLEIIQIGIISGESDSTDLDRATISYFFSINDSIKTEFKKGIYIGKKLKQDEIGGCLDGLGHDVIFTLCNENEANCWEILFGCDNFKEGILQKSTDASTFFKVSLSSKLQSEIANLIAKYKTSISEYKLKK
jgi:hypothetical protein